MLSGQSLFFNQRNFYFCLHELFKLSGCTKLRLKGRYKTRAFENLTSPSIVGGLSITLDRWLATKDVDWRERNRCLPIDQRATLR